MTRADEQLSARVREEHWAEPNLKLNQDIILPNQLIGLFQAEGVAEEDMHTSNLVSNPSTVNPATLPDFQETAHQVISIKRHGEASQTGIGAVDLAGKLNINQGTGLSLSKVQICMVYCSLIL